MKFSLKDKFNSFLKGPNDYPLLAGFSVGFYALVFYFSNNFDLVNSYPQLFFFLSYFMLFPIVTVFTVGKILQKSRFSAYIATGILIVMVLLLPLFVFGAEVFICSNKRIATSVVVAALISFACVKFKINHYKYLIVFVFLMSILPATTLGKIIYLNLTNPTDWQTQPDHILETQFKKTPNIYYIQPDGYANDVNLRGPLYRFDNSGFDNWLKSKNFTLYNDYRSNYESTYFSNASCFFMKHHYSNEYANFKYSRDFIMGENPVLKILKNNNYKTFFISERPYLMMNRPTVYYDFCNFEFSEIPNLSDGLFKFKDITEEVQRQIQRNRKTNNFFFIEKFQPCHIAVQKPKEGNVETERRDYIDRLKLANDWLKQIVSYIEKNDPNSIVIIGADHGGFVGFESTHQALAEIKDPHLLNSIFGAKLAIKWNNLNHKDYDSNLRTPVNLFRILFSFLSQDKSLLKSLQSNVSYNSYDPNDFSKIYQALDAKGNAVFLKKI